MTTERDRFLTEKTGRCWHHFVPLKDDSRYECAKCGMISAEAFLNDKYLDFSTPDGFFTLWKWAREQGESWKKFIKWLADEGYWARDVVDLVDPGAFADVFYKFLKEETK